MFDSGSSCRLPTRGCRPGKNRSEISCPIEERDFYPDALDCLRRFRDAGYAVALAGNQPLEAEAALAGLGLPVSFVASSARWGVEKPSAGFFEKVAAEAGCPPEHIAYVGDRLDNDVLYARLPEADRFDDQPDERYLVTAEV